MNVLSHCKPAVISMSFLIFLLTSATVLPAAQYNEAVSGQDYLYVKGQIRTVSTANQSLTLQQKKGEKINILITPATELEGFFKLEDLQRRQTIKVWYRSNESGNTALKIEKPPDTGC